LVGWLVLVGWFWLVGFGWSLVKRRTIAVHLDGRKAAVRSSRFQDHYSIGKCSAANSCTRDPLPAPSNRRARILDPPAASNRPPRRRPDRHWLKRRQDG